MCYVFLDSVIAHGAKSITLLYEHQRPVVAPEHRMAADIEIVQGQSYDVGLPHFNLRFKLPNLAKLDYPFLYLDADMVVLGDLNYLWERRHLKPWIGIDHQVVPSVQRTHRSPFLNSGLQLVSDPDFYDLRAILGVQEAAAPLRLYKQIPKNVMFPCPGADQAVLFRYFQTIGYDYRHPEIGFGWNSCAGVTVARFEEGIWKGRTQGLALDHDVYINHYWDQFKPWAIGCPIFESYAWVDERLPKE
jgi:hypothetical protein